MLSIFSRIIPSKYRKIEHLVPGLLSESEFSDTLRRDILRSDRSLRSITILSFSIMDSDLDHGKELESLVRFANIVNDNIRSSDVKGWYKKNSKLSVSVILYNTNLMDSERVVRILYNGFYNHYNCSNNKVDTILCTMFSYPQVHDENNLSVYIKKFEYEFPNMRFHIDDFLEYNFPTSKRALDIAGSLIGLILLFPLFVVVSIYIKIVSPGPIFFMQKRVGFNKKYFMMIKFRSMHVNSDECIHRKYVAKLIKESSNNKDQCSNIPMKKIDEDDRIIPCGNILRKSCIDELPQLINVLVGDMSLVGPRPAIQYEFDEYQHWHTKRVDIKPGMTGLWQVKGKNNIPFKDMVRLDINYCRNVTFWLDVKILFLTPFVIFSQIFEDTKTEELKSEVVNNV